MSIDVYDVDLGKQLGSFKTEAEALERVRLLLDDVGPGYVHDLEIGNDDGRPNLTGTALLRRVEVDEQRSRARSAARTAVGR